jgi:hypothetical protein
MFIFRMYEKEGNKKNITLKIKKVFFIIWQRQINYDFRTFF